MAPSKGSQLSPLLDTSLDTWPARGVSRGSHAPGQDSTWLTPRGCQHPRLLAPALPPCFKDDGAPVTWGNPTFLLPPAPWESLGLGKVSFQTRPWESTMYPVNNPGTSKIREGPRSGRFLSAPDFTGHGASHDPGIRKPARCWSQPTTSQLCKLAPLP